MYYKIFANCIMVEGYNNGLVYDLQREKLFKIPKDFISLLNENDGKKVDGLYKGLNSENIERIDEVIKFLLGEDLIYTSSKPIIRNRFPKLNEVYFESSILSNIIISIFNDFDDQFFIKKINNIVNLVKCKRIQIRFEKGVSKLNFKKVLKSFDNSILRYISLILDSDDAINIDIEKTILLYPRIMSITFYNYKEQINFFDKEEFKHIEFIKCSDGDFPFFLKLNNLRFLYFNPNIIKYSESKTNNLYYNKKAYIESNGSIYASPFSNTIHGNIFKDSILDIVNTSEFRALWNINKEIIKVCKDCEYRYTCVDGRIPKKDNNNEYYFEDECLYNPYNNEFNKK